MCTNYSDPIHIAALSAYLATFPLTNIPLDMSIRFLLLTVPLPREQEAIYRLLELFSKQYLAANPLLFDNFDQVFVVCYSMIMLNTDMWNVANKMKMTREQYVKNTSGQGVCEDILSVRPQSPPQRLHSYRNTSTPNITFDFCLCCIVG
jgi:Sec7-like guanine-nucleotide exchange factor